MLLARGGQGFSPVVIAPVSPRVAKGAWFISLAVIPPVPSLVADIAFPSGGFLVPDGFFLVLCNHLEVRDIPQGQENSLSSKFGGDRVRRESLVDHNFHGLADCHRLANPNKTRKTTGEGWIAGGMDVYPVEGAAKPLLPQLIVKSVVGGKILRLVKLGSDSGKLVNIGSKHELVSTGSVEAWGGCHHPNHTSDSSQAEE